MAQLNRKTQKIISTMTEEAIRCRINSHRWKPWNAHKVVGAFETEEHCENCPVERHSVISNRGAVIRRHLKYPPEGYLREKGQGRMEPEELNALRLTVLQWDFGVK